MELLALAGGGVHPAVVHPRADHLDLPDPGGELAGWGVAVAAHQPMAVLVDQLGEARRCRRPPRPPAPRPASGGRPRGPARPGSIASSLRAASSMTTLSMSRRSFLAGGGPPASFLQVRVEGTPRSHARGSSTDFDDISYADQTQSLEHSRVDRGAQPPGRSHAYLQAELRDLEARVTRQLEEHAAGHVRDDTWRGA